MLFFFFSFFPSLIGQRSGEATGGGKEGQGEEKRDRALETRK